MSGENNIYQPGPLVKLFGAPEAKKAVQDASARFPRVWIRRQMEARRRRISALPRGGVGTPGGGWPRMCPWREVSEIFLVTFLAKSQGR